MIRDHEFDTISAEEQSRHDEEEALARRIRREIRRVERGEEDERMREEALEEEAERLAIAEAERKRLEREEKRRNNIIRKLLSGTILIDGNTQRYYPYLLTIAAMSLLSIMVMFWSLHQDVRFSQLKRETQILKQQALRLEEMRYSRTTHSAIVGELKRRNIDLNNSEGGDLIIE